MVMDAKTAILARAREAIERSQEGRPVREIPRNYIREGQHAPGSDEVVAEMIEKLEDYSAQVVEARDDQAIEDAIATFLSEYVRIRARTLFRHWNWMQSMPSSLALASGFPSRERLSWTANLIKDAVQSLLFPILMWQFWNAPRSFQPCHRPSIS